MSKSTGGNAGGMDPAALRAQHSTVYQNSTSDIKDDIPQLLAVMRSGHGPLSRQEAAFLAWYHALEGYDRQEEMILGGAVSVCLQLLDSADISPAGKTCAAGILMALCEEEDLREGVARGKAGGSTTCAVLHNLLQEQRGTMQKYAARCLRLLAEDSAAQNMLLRAMDGQLLYGQLYRDVLLDCHVSPLVAQLTHYLVNLLAKRPEMRAQAVDHGLLEACVMVLREHKTDSSVCNTLKLLLLLLEDPYPPVARFLAQDGLRLLVDLVGAPPKTIQAAEWGQYPSLLDPAWARAEEQARQEAATAAAEADARAAAATGAAGDGPTPERSTSRTPSTRRGGSAGALRAVQATEHSRPKDVPTLLTSGMESPRGGGSGGPHATTPPLTTRRTGQPEEVASPVRLVAGAAHRVADPYPDLDPRTLLSINSAALKWHSLASLQTRCLAAGCMYALMAHNTDHMQAMSDRLAVSRLVPLLLQVMPAEGDGAGKKKTKKKGLALTPEQTQHLVQITGCLKFLSLANVNKYRIAALGAVDLLAQLYNESSHTLLRRNAQVVLGNVALLAENGQRLLDGQLPEEFLVPKPMRLVAEEEAQLQREFPEAGIGKRGPAGTARAPGVLQAAQVRVT